MFSGIYQFVKDKQDLWNEKISDLGGIVVYFQKQGVQRILIALPETDKFDPKSRKPKSMQILEW